MGAETSTSIETIPLSDAPSLTIKEFCELEKISRTSFFKMAKEGNGPETLRIPSLATVRITARARREWQERMAARQDDPRVREKKERRVEISRRAGKLGGAPKHQRSRNSRRARRS